MKKRSRDEKSREDGSTFHELLDRLNTMSTLELRSIANGAETALSKKEVAGSLESSLLRIVNEAVPIRGDTREEQEWCRAIRDALFEVLIEFCTSAQESRLGIDEIVMRTVRRGRIIVQREHITDIVRNALAAMRKERLLQ